MSWYSKGTEEVKKAAQREQEQRANQPPKRIWIDYKNAVNECRVVYLDDIGFTFQEHKVEIPGSKMPAFVTCVRPMGRPCPLCEAMNRAYFITMYSVVDLSVWKDRNGVEHKNEKKIHALKGEAALSLATKSQRWGGVVGKAVILTRKGQKDHASGSDFELMLNNGAPVVYKLDPSKPEFKPFEYERFFAPKSDEEMQEIIRMAGLGSKAGVAVNFSAPAGNPNPWGQPAQQQPQFGDLGAEMVSAPPARSSEEDLPF